MADAGRILIIPKGDYDANSTYEKLDLVKHKGTSWLAKKDVIGIEPSAENSEHWQSLFGISIVDNLDTEEAGQALDARQGKVLDEKIDSVNSHLQFKNIGESIGINSDFISDKSISVYKLGNIVYVNGNLLASHVMDNLFVLSLGGHAPVSPVEIPMIGMDGTNGKMLITNEGSEAKAYLTVPTASVLYVFNGTYVVAV